MKSPLTRALAYFLVDAVAFAINILLFLVLTSYAGVYYLISTALGFWAQIVIAFFINRSGPFHSRTSTTRGLSITSLVNLCAFAVAVAGTAVGVEVLHLDYLTARIIVGIIAGIIGFLLDSEFTFLKNPFK